MSLNVTRRLVGGVGAAEVGSEARRLSTLGAPPGIFKVVVVDVIYDPDSLTSDQKQTLKENVTNPEFVESMPQNTIIGRMISAGQDISSPNPSLFYPFFSSHFSLPVQAGEQVSVMYEDMAQQGNALGRWFTRVHEGTFVEDVNYTHGDRRFDPINTRRTSTDATPPTDNIPFFPNGGGTLGSYSLQPSGSNNPYDIIVRDAFASKINTFEPVPRWVKRPQETVIQGTNNALIMLGQDRTGPATRVTGSSQRDRTAFAGTVDIVCGRGRGNIPYNTSNPPSNPTDERTGTSPDVVENSRHKLETDKTPFKRDRNRRRNKNEGNPDFKRDAARIYVSMNTAGDRNFRTGHSTNPEEGFQYPENTIRPIQIPERQGGIGSSYGVVKADHVRIIARKETNPEIKGTFLLLREGVANEDLVFVYGEEGKLQLDAKEIFIGPATTKAEPYIKWSVYNDQMQELKRQINALADQVKGMSDSYTQAFSTSQAVPFSPIASLVTVGNVVKGIVDPAIQHIKQSIDSIEPANAKSNKIFGV